VANARRNIELKARDPTPTQSIEACRALDAETRGTIWQRDSYFDVPYGGLKLRVRTRGNHTSSSSNAPTKHSNARADTGSLEWKILKRCSLRSQQPSA
jgi:adenylate cyclase class IV